MRTTAVCYFIGDILIFVAGARAGSVLTMVAAAFFFAGLVFQLRSFTNAAPAPVQAEDDLYPAPRTYNPDDFCGYTPVPKGAPGPEDVVALYVDKDWVTRPIYRKDHDAIVRLFDEYPENEAPHSAAAHADAHVVGGCPLCRG